MPQEIPVQANVLVAGIFHPVQAVPVGIGQQFITTESKQGAQQQTGTEFRHGRHGRKTPDSATTQ